MGGVNTESDVDQIIAQFKAEALNPIGPCGSWVIEANIKPDPRAGSNDIPVRRGTRKFRGGAKVHTVGLHAGAGQHIAVVGRHRSARDYLWCVIPVVLLECLRSKVLYSPGIAKLMCQALTDGSDRKTRPPRRDCFFETLEKAEAAMNSIQANIDYLSKQTKLVKIEDSDLPVT